MNIIIGGCGRVGALLATRLFLEGHDVSVIDQNRASFGRLGAGFGGRTILGKVFDRDVMTSAGVEHADVYCALTSGDNSNVVSAKVAKEIFGVPRVVARIYDPRRAEIYRRLGIPAVSSVTWSANEIHTLAVHPGITNEATFGDGEVRLVSVHIPPRLDGRNVDDLMRTGELLVAAVVRSGAAFVPTPGALLRAGDLVHIVAAVDSLDHLAEMLAP